MNIEMEAYFKRLLSSWQRRGSALPKIAPGDGEQPLIYEGPPDEYGYVSWRPAKKTVYTDLTPVESAIEMPVHPSVKDYLNSYWFAEMAGKYGNLGITLMPVLPGIELQSFLAKLVGYKEAHNDRLEHIPLGVEFNGDLVVVNNRTGEVELEDYERGEFRTIAPKLETLIAGLTP
jgi:hypothetical protein